ncbi:MAG: DUF3078 domain-containing protein [Odoribacter sp.]
MKYRIIFTLSIGVLTGILAPANAQPTENHPWNRGGMTAINLSQISLSNWAAGGENSLGFNLQFNYFANYKKEKHLWQNRLELAYGLNKTKSEGRKKTNDKIYLSSTYGYQLIENLYLSGLLTFQSQFAKGYDYNMTPDVFLSRFMAPGYLTVGPGLTWTPKSWLTVTLSPATWRGTFVTNKILSEQGAFGVTPGKHLLSEFGANLNAEASYEFLKNMKVFSRLNLFSNYLKKPQNIVVNWDVLVNMTINQWFSAYVSTNLIYDDKIKIAQKDGSKGARLQFKEALGIGFQVTF